MGTGEIGTDPISQVVGREQASGFDYSPLAMDPLGFDETLPGTLDRQLVHQQTNSHSGALDRLVVLADRGNGRPC
jgi:hypothetical protein